MQASFSDEYDDGFPYRQADLTVSLVKDGICVTTFVILMIILVPLMNVTGNLRTYIRNSNTGIHDTLIEDYEIIDDSVDEERKLFIMKHRIMLPEMKKL